MFSVITVPNFSLDNICDQTVGNLLFLFTLIRYSFPSLENPPYSLQYFKFSESDNTSISSSFSSIKDVGKTSVS